MLPIFDSLRGLDYGSLLFRLLITVLCGAAIGTERSMKNRPAGFRTHILVCLGGAVAAITGNYLYLGLHLPADVTRISSQVITGLGFIGAGTIIVTGSSDIKGLTTAAGLWATGIIGLSIGSGFYEGGLLATLLVLFIEIILAPVGRKLRPLPRFSVQLQYVGKEALDAVLAACRKQHLTIRRMQVQSVSGQDNSYEAVLELQGVRQPEAVLDLLNSSPGVLSATRFHPEAP